MRSPLIALVALLASSGLAVPDVLERAACTTNACLAALSTRTATARPDCTSFLATTVTPCVRTVKSTVTLTTTIGCPFNALSSATVSDPAASTTAAACPASATPSVLPAYASGACDAAAYSSACGCINARASKTTLPASTITATLYKTVKASPTFTVKQVEGQYRGYWLWSRTPRGQQGTGGYLGLTDSRDDAEYFAITANGTMLGANGTAAWGSQAENCHGCYDVTYEFQPDGSNSKPMTCKLGSALTGDGYLAVTCKAVSGATVFQNCSPDGDGLDMGGSPERSFFDCFVAKLGAYPICS